MQGILSGPEIRKQIELGRITIDPYDPRKVNPASIDLTLGKGVSVYRNSYHWAPKMRRSDDGSTMRPSNGPVWDSKKPQEVDTFEMNEKGWVLQPGIGYLLHTAERVTTNHFVPVLDGKALALDTEIPTPSGWKTMQDLKVGDLVYGSGGYPTRVTHATETLLGRPCFELHFSDKTSIVADASHQWWVHPVDAKPGIRTTSQMAARKHRKGVSIFRIPSVAIQGEHTALPVPPYTLGAWLGDGTSVNSCITVHDKNLQILEEIRKEGVTTELQSRKGPHGTYLLGRGSQRLRGNRGQFKANDSLHSALKELGILKAKTIPESYLKASYGQRWSLLQGLMDTDGSVHRDDQASITLSDERLFQDVRQLCHSLGLVTYMDERPSKIKGRVVGTAYRLTWRATPELFRLDSKHFKVRHSKKWLEEARHPLRGITSITPTESVPVKCITVEAEDGLFLATRSCILTHNSSVGRAFVLVHYTAGYGDPGFDGQYTLEVTALTPIRIYPGMRFCQIRFHTLVGEPLLYQENGHYQGKAAEGAVPSQLHKQFD